jgi:hypothetical protein
MVGVLPLTDFTILPPFEIGIRAGWGNCRGETADIGPDESGDGDIVIVGWSVINLGIGWPASGIDEERTGRSFVGGCGSGVDTVLIVRVGRLTRGLSCCNDLSFLSGEDLCLGIC